MKNEEKARILSNHDYLTDDDYALCPSNETIVRINAYRAALEMAAWKEQQMIEFLLKKQEEAVDTTTASYLGKIIENFKEYMEE